ncbi:LysM peptidoglycan-binding domain-containing protein [Marinobacter adhaerens]|uniref:LysM peptidoglycan-binding domain-containing protein n=1 Tax=Marinobacter adhaerens TaxID=1033846 RepID=A0A851HUC6_9GAMM|nr:LysM domain-containing protein [Marinobacter adhaerens]NWN91146.1 LysM peptidoglycan-binding domain-containing protein [Marinobacter adhaerens]
MPTNYEVISGDTLGAIAERHDATVTRLLRLNPAIENPDQIYPGQILAVPAANEVITSSTEPDEVICKASCEDEIVEIVHETGSNEIIFLTKAEAEELAREENTICGPIEAFYKDLENLSGGEPDSEDRPKEAEGSLKSEVQERKQALVDDLVAKGAISDDMQSIPRLTEIKRLSGKKHRSYVRSDKMKNHPRRYSIASRDKARSKGWLTSDGINGKKLAEAIESEFKVQVKLDLGSPDPEGAMMQVLNQFYDEAEWSVWGKSQKQKVAETGFDASAEALFMRFAAGASGFAEYNPEKGKVHIQATGQAQYVLAEGKMTIEQSFPASNKSEIRFYYRMGGWDGERKYASLGHFQATLAIIASGYAGASAVIAANVHVDSSEGLPKLKGIAGRKKGQSANIEGSVFAGVRAGCEVTGELRWKDVLTPAKKWDTLCKVGKKVEVAAGAAAEFEVRLMFSRATGKFYFNCHAGLVLGVGPSGSFLLEIETNNIMKMLHFVYNALLDVDFRYLELFDTDTETFIWYQRLSLLALGKGISALEAAYEFANSSIYDIAGYIEAAFSNRAREQNGAELAENVLNDLKLKEDAVFLHSPPEVKGVVLDNILYDWWVTPHLWDSKDLKIQAVNKILSTFQGWRDFEETVLRMNPRGTARPEEFQKNLDRLFDFVGMEKTDRRLFTHQLKNTVAVSGRPVRLDPFKVCKICGIA